MSMTVDGDDRRRFYRIEDRVSLTVKPVPPDDLDLVLARLDMGHRDKMSLASAFANTSAEMKHSVERVRRELPDVARYLEGLNEKLDLLVQMMAADDSDLAEAPTTRVNLSASGVAFTGPENWPVGTLLEARMLIFPDYVCVLAFGEVVRNQRSAEGYEVAMEFTHIRDNDRELIVRHVTRRQAALLRKARLSLEEEGLASA